jgi:chromosome segregation ATPase
MKTLKRIAIAAIAGLGGLGALTFAQAQDYTGKLRAARPEMDTLMQSRQYGEVAMRVREMFPSGIPDLPQNPANPQIAVANLGEMTSILALHDYLQRALFMSGKTEEAIDCMKKAEEIAKKSAADTEAGLVPTIKSTSATIRESTDNIDKATAAKEQAEADKAKLETEKAQLESMKKRKKADNQRLDAINAELEELGKSLASMERDIDVWRSNARTATAAVSQLNGFVSTAKKDAAKFAPEIEKMESDLAAERNTIDSAFKGNKAKYVAKSLPGASAVEDQNERARSLNRLLFLDPKSAAVKKQIAALGNP